MIMIVIKFECVHVGINKNKTKVKKAHFFQKKLKFYAQKCLEF